MKVPATLAGKKIKCKGCAQVVAVPAPKPAAPAKPALLDEEDDGPKQYGLIDDDIGVRCPHCAGELQAGQVICLNCGYNTVTRQRVESKKTYEITSGDYFKWLFPGFLAAGTVITIVILDVVWIFMIPWLFEYMGFAEVGAPRLNYLNPCSFWTVVLSFFIIVPCFIFAMRRLVFNPTPPEIVKRDDEKDA
jgi:hypothetical protein